MADNIIEVHCRTNLDLRGEVWPLYFPSVPRIGERVQSTTKHQGGFQLELEVCMVTYKQGGYRAYPVVELHFTSLHRNLTSRKEGVEKGSIRAFYEWYAAAIGVHESAFI